MGRAIRRAAGLLARAARSSTQAAISVESGAQLSARRLLGSNAPSLGAAGAATQLCVDAIDVLPTLSA